MEWPLHTFVVPLYNGSKHIHECLDNIFGTTYPNYEVIVVDDGSVDDSAEIVRKHFPQVKLIQQSNQGPSIARNTGLYASKGNFISFLDQDDLFVEGRTMQFMKYLLDRPDLDIVGGRVMVRNEDGADNRTDIMIFENIEEKRTLGLNIGSMLYRRRVFDKIGPFSDKIFTDDVDFFIRIRESNLKVNFLKSAGLIYRVHNTNMTRALLDGTHHNTEFLATLHQSIKRRRSNASIKIRSMSELDKMDSTTTENDEDH